MLTGPVPRVRDRVKPNGEEELERSLQSTAVLPGRAATHDSSRFGSPAASTSGPELHVNRATLSVPGTRLSVVQWSERVVSSPCSTNLGPTGPKNVGEQYGVLHAFGELEAPFCGERNDDGGGDAVMHDGTSTTFGDVVPPLGRVPSRRAVLVRDRVEDLGWIEVPVVSGRSRYCGHA